MPKDPGDKFHITFTAEGVGSVRVFKDSTAPTISGGYGGWQVVDRARQRGLSQWNGVEPRRLTIPILFDGFGNGDNQEDELKKLLKMATPDPNEPPVVTIDGKGFPEIAEKWVIEDIQFGSNAIWGTDSQGKDSLLRQDAVVNLMQYVAGDRIAFSKAKPAQPGGRVWPKHYTVKKGDTLQKIAAMKEYYGTPKLWHLIAKANNIHDPKHLKVGKLLTIPNPKGGK